MNIKKWQSHLILPFDLSTSSDVGGRGPKACETRDKVRSTRELDRSDSARIPDTGGKVARNYLRAVVSRTRHSRRGSTTLEPGNKCSSSRRRAQPCMNEEFTSFFFFFFFLFTGWFLCRSINRVRLPKKNSRRPSRHATSRAKMFSVAASTNAEFSRY